MHKTALTRQQTFLADKGAAGVAVSWYWHSHTGLPKHAKAETLHIRIAGRTANATARQLWAAASGHFH